MKNRSETGDALHTMQEKLTGLGEGSLRKTYYPELQKRLEELERFKAFIDHSNDAIFLVEVPTGRIVDVNESASRQMGWPREEFLVASLFDFSDLRSCACARELIEASRENGSERALAVGELYRKDDGSFPAEITLNRMHFRDGSYVLASARDISERKRLEAQLLQSQKMEAIGQLASGVAHDFNNILMLIMGYGNILKRELPLETPQREKLDMIIDASEKAAQLTGSLLAFGRKPVMKPRAANLNDIVLHMQKFLARIIGEDVLLSSVIHDGEPWVRVDSSQIEQVLINLATNARDAMPRGGMLTIETGILDVDTLFVQANGYGEPGRYAVLSVSDTGMGMDERTKERIFEPFFTTKEAGKGTGLGMPIVQGIVRHHNGFITLYSEPHLGTTFRIHIPLIGRERAAEDESRTHVADPPGGTETIIVAEDETAVRTLLVDLLARCGYDVIPAENGQEAVEKFASNKERVRLVLMDMIMPRMSGREAGKEILKIDVDARILYTSGYTMAMVQHRDPLEDGVELIMKPIQPTELLRKIRELLDPPS